MDFIELRFGQAGLDDEDRNVQREIIPVDSLLDVYIELPEKKMLSIVFKSGTGRTCHRHEYFRNEIDCLKRYLGICHKLKARADRVTDGIIFCASVKHAEEEEAKRVALMDEQAEKREKSEHRNADKDDRQRSIVEKLRPIYETPYIVRTVDAPVPLYFDLYFEGEAMATAVKDEAMRFKAKDVAEKASREISSKYKNYTWEVADLRQEITAEERLLWAIYGTMDETIYGTMDGSKEEA